MDSIRKEKRNGEIRARLQVLMVSLALALSAGSCKPAKTKESANKVKKVRTVLVRVATLKEKLFIEKVALLGNLLPMKQVKIIPQISGIIRRHYVEEGDRVKKGQKLTAIKATDFYMAARRATSAVQAGKAGVAQARTHLANMQIQYNRYIKLKKAGAIPVTQFDQVASANRLAKSQVQLAKAQLAMAEEGQRSARTKLSDALIKAPFDATVVKRLVDEGETVMMMPPTVLMMLMDMSSLKAEGALPESVLHLLKKNHPVSITVDAYPGKIFPGTIKYIAPMVDPRSQTISIRAAISNKDRLLKPGMSATLTVALGQTRTVALPRDAITELRGDKADFFIIKNNRAFFRTTRVGNRHGNEFMIKPGLSLKERLLPGTVVVLAGQSRLSNNTLVKIIDNETGASAEKMPKVSGRPPETRKASPAGGKGGTEVRR